MPPKPDTTPAQTSLDTLTALIQQLVNRETVRDSVNIKSMVTEHVKAQLAATTTSPDIKALVAEQVKAQLAITPATSTSATPTPRSPKPPKVSEANNWNSSPTTINHFFNKLALVFTADKERYGAVDAKIHYAFSKFTGDHARQYKDNIIGLVLKGEKAWETWDNFEKEIHISFPSINLTDQAQRELEIL
jgi:hypothetical protein